MENEIKIQKRYNHIKCPYCENKSAPQSTKCNFCGAILNSDYDKQYINWEIKYKDKFKKEYKKAAILEIMCLLVFGGIIFAGLKTYDNVTFATFISLCFSFFKKQFTLGIGFLIFYIVLFYGLYQAFLLKKDPYIYSKKYSKNGLGAGTNGEITYFYGGNLLRIINDFNTTSNCDNCGYLNTFTQAHHDCVNCGAPAGPRVDKEFNEAVMQAKLEDIVFANYYLKSVLLFLLILTFMYVLCAVFI